MSDIADRLAGLQPGALPYEGTPDGPTLAQRLDGVHDHLQRVVGVLLAAEPAVVALRSMCDRLDTPDRPLDTIAHLEDAAGNDPVDRARIEHWTGRLVEAAAILEQIGDLP